MNVFDSRLPGVLVSFLVLRDLTEGMKAVCFTLCSCCHVAMSILCLFLAVPQVGLWSVIVAFPHHTYFFSASMLNRRNKSYHCLFDFVVNSNRAGTTENRKQSSLNNLKSIILMMHEYL